VKNKKIKIYLIGKAGEEFLSRHLKEKSLKPQTNKLLTQIMQFNNADVVEKFIFRYPDLPLTNGSRILVNITNEDIFNKSIELNKFLNNVCIIQVKLM
jgi:hypothetical protein